MSKEFLRDRPGLYCIELRTSNWPASVEWYRQVLGLRVLVRVVDDGYALLEAGETRLALLARESPGEPSARISFAFEVHDRTALIARLDRSGVTIKESTDHPGRAARGQSDRSRRQPHPPLLLAQPAVGRTSDRHGCKATKSELSRTSPFLLSRDLPAVRMQRGIGTNVDDSFRSPRRLDPLASSQFRSLVLSWRCTPLPQCFSSQPALCSILTPVGTALVVVAVGIAMPRAISGRRTTRRLRVGSREGRSKGSSSFSRAGTRQRPKRFCRRNSLTHFPRIGTRSRPDCLVAGKPKEAEKFFNANLDEDSEGTANLFSLRRLRAQPLRHRQRREPVLFDRP